MINKENNVEFCFESDLILSAFILRYLSLKYYDSLKFCKLADLVRNPHIASKEKRIYAMINKYIKRGMIERRRLNDRDYEIRITSKGLHCFRCLKTTMSDENLDDFPYIEIGPECIIYRISPYK